MPFSLATAPEINYFVGRVKNVSSIESALFPITGERKIVVLYGLGGIGKSQLAIEYAKKHRYDYTAVFWLNAKTEDTLKRSFAAGAARLPKKHFDQELLRGSQDQQALGVILHEMKAWLNLPDNHRWLLIFDNVDNPKISENKDQDAYDVRSYFPETHQGSILVTTRWSTLSIGHLLEVAKLSTAADSVSLLEETSCRAIGKESGIGDLLEILDGLPLSLATAGGYLRMTGISVTEYLHDYKASWLELQKTSPGPLSYEDKRIYSTWDLSYNHIREEDESAAKLLEFCAYLDNQDLWYDLLKAGDSERAPDWFQHIVGTEQAFRGAVSKLQNHALVERLKDSRGYSMHHCVHAWVKNVLSKTVEDQNMILALACVRDTIPREKARDDWVIKRRLIPHIERLLELLSDWDQVGRNKTSKEMRIVQFFASVGVLYLDQGKLTKAESMLLRVFDSVEEFCGSVDEESMLNLFHSLAILYSRQGHFTKAESMYQRALTGSENTLGPDNESTLSLFNDLGTLYDQQGKLKDAESMYQRALVGQEKTLGPDHLSTLHTVHNLGNLYRYQGRLTEAESMFQRALPGYERILGPDHASTLCTIHNYGVLYREQGRLREAEFLLSRVLIGYTRNPPPDPKDQLLLFFNTGLVYQGMQYFEKAKGFFSQAYEGYQRLLGSEHEMTIKALTMLNEETEREKQGAESSGG